MGKTIYFNLGQKILGSVAFKFTHLSTIDKPRSRREIQHQFGQISQKLRRFIISPKHKCFEIKHRVQGSPNQIVKSNSYSALH